MAAQDDDAAKRIHGEFMQMALQLVDGRLDSSQYEDSCRQLLGICCPPADCFGLCKLNHSCSVHMLRSLQGLLVVRIHNECRNIQQKAVQQSCEVWASILKLTPPCKISP